MVSTILFGLQNTGGTVVGLDFAIGKQRNLYAIKSGTLTMVALRIFEVGMEVLSFYTWYGTLETLMIWWLLIEMISATRSQVYANYSCLHVLIRDYNT